MGKEINDSNDDNRIWKSACMPQAFKQKCNKNHTRTWTIRDRIDMVIKGVYCIENM